MRRLPTEAQLLDEGEVARCCRALEIVKQGTAVVHHLDETTTGVVVMRIGLEMFREMLNALGEDSNLNIARSGVLLVHLELFADRLEIDLAHCLCKL